MSQETLDTNMILHTVVGSPNSRKVLATLSHLGLEAQIRSWNLFKGELRSAEYLAINPTGKAPTLVDGDFHLWESRAIMQYLAEKAGETPLFPRDARTRADITRWQIWEGLYFNAAMLSLAFEFVAKPRNNAGPADDAAVAQANASLARHAPVLDGHLAGRQFLVGDHLTLADYSLAVFEPYVDLVHFDFSPYRNILRYAERMRGEEHWIRSGQRPAVQSAAA
jgi:glutathione S-transferase